MYNHQLRRLYNKNKQQILNGKELTDIHINGACALLREEYPEISQLFINSMIGH